MGLGKCSRLILTLFVLKALCITGYPAQAAATNEVGIEELESDGAKESYGCSSCPATKEDKINIHIVPHSHDDVGWLKTVDQYYYGTRKVFSPVGVQHILDSVIPQLMMDPEKRFIYVEMSFFSKWWAEQNQQMKSIVKRLVNEGRLEFINGGWCMNDEATVSYQSTIEQMTLGLRFLQTNFGQCGHPKAGWQIDPFGHTNEQASLFQQFGFDGMYFSRISYRDKQQRISNKSLDLMWHGDVALKGGSGSIFTNIFKDGYDAPNGFCFDVFCLDDELVDNKQSHEYNIERLGNKYIDYVRDYAKHKATNHVLVPMGGDFQYSAAGINFKNLDKLIRYVRSRASDLHIFYSTPSCYQRGVNEWLRSSPSDTSDVRYNVSDVFKSTRSLPEKWDDFLPYDSSMSVWWSGFFSSRPSVKLIEREVANLLQVVRMMSFSNLLRTPNQVQLENMESENLVSSWEQRVAKHESECLQSLWEILGDLQHHDAITGTEKQHVNDDYVRRASDAIAMCSKFVGKLRRIKMTDYLYNSTEYKERHASKKVTQQRQQLKLDPIYLAETQSCPLLNISQCDPLEADLDSAAYMRSNNINNSLLKSLDAELKTRSVLLTIYNPLSRRVLHHDVRLPCNGRCDLSKLRITHVASNTTMSVSRLPVSSGVLSLPFRDAITVYDMLFYANLPALGYATFLIEDTNRDEMIDEDSDAPESILVSEERTLISSPETVRQTPGRIRRVKRVSEDKEQNYYQYFEMPEWKVNPTQPNHREKRQAESGTSNGQQQSTPHNDRVVVKFDTRTGTITELRRASDGKSVNITQKFGSYFPAHLGHQPGAYIFRPNSSEPQLFDKPIQYKLYKRNNGSLIEIHQKWTNWIWQTIRLDDKKNYIEFDYVVGPVPVVAQNTLGREVITRYITNMNTNGIFLTDSNGRQLLPRRRFDNPNPNELGGSFFPVVSTIMMRDLGPNQSPYSTPNKSRSVEALAILVDRAQAGTSLHSGQLELLIHRRQMRDDEFGVSEALNEPGEDGRGLVTRGKHKLFLKFDDSNLDVSKQRAKPIIYKLPESKPVSDRKRRDSSSSSPIYLIHDPVFNEVRVESVKELLKPIYTFDRLRVTADEFLALITDNNQKSPKTDSGLINQPLPPNIHLLTLQPLSNEGPNKYLFRLENLDNPLTLSPKAGPIIYQSILNSYRYDAEFRDAKRELRLCKDESRQPTVVNIENLIKKIVPLDFKEYLLGADLNKEKKFDRLKWVDEEEVEDCSLGQYSIAMGVREIRTYIANFQRLNSNLTSHQCSFELNQC